MEYPKEFIDFYNIINYTITEGSVIGEEVQYLVKFLQMQLHLTDVLEIGFNGGLSAAAILSANPEIKLTSVDLGEHDYIHAAKKNIDTLFPGRHTLLVGSSLDVLPKLASEGKVFDFIFLDGGHVEPVPRKDIENCTSLIKGNTFVIIDDWCDAHGPHGVNQAIEDNMANGVLVLKDKQLVADRGWGLFVMKRVP